MGDSCMRGLAGRIRPNCSHHQRKPQFCSGPNAAQNASGWDESNHVLPVCYRSAPCRLCRHRSAFASLRQVTQQVAHTAADPRPSGRRPCGSKKRNAGSPEESFRDVCVDQSKHVHYITVGVAHRGHTGIGCCVAGRVIVVPHPRGADLSS